MKKIYLVSKGKKKIAFSFLTTLCKHYRFSYNTLSRKEFPIEWKGLKIEKINLK